MGTPHEQSSNQIQAFIVRFKNYFLRVYNSMRQFFQQYLSPQGQILLRRFNFYMIIIMFINVEIAFLVLLILLVFVIGKIVKIKLWKKRTYSQLPLSFRQQIRHKIQQKFEQNPLKRQLIESYHKNRHIHGLRTSQNSIDIAIKRSQNKEKQQTLLISMSRQQLERKVYELLNSGVNSYLSFLRFSKWKTFYFLGGIVLFLKIFQPSFSDDAYHIVASHKNGQIQIEKIKRASEYLNQFYLFMIWALVNIGCFYYYGTKKLHKELFQEIYTVEYEDLMKKSKMKFSRKITNLDDNMIKKQSYVEQLDPRKFKTCLIKKPAKQNNQNQVDFFQKKKTPQIQRRKSDDLVELSKYSIDKKIAALFDQPQSNNPIRKRCNIDFVQSEEESSEEQTFKVLTSKKTTRHEELKEITQQQEEMSVISSVIRQPNDEDGKQLYRKATFVPHIHHQNILKHPRKHSQDYIKSRFNDSKPNFVKIPTHREKNVQKL